MPLGYTSKIFMLPFDHRTSFARGLVGTDKNLTPEQVARLKELKGLIYKGFALAVESGNVPRSSAAMLVDEELGDDILRAAKQAGYIIFLPVEKSGQEEFDFEFGDKFPEHVAKYQPNFVKALVRYNPEDDKALNARQLKRLKKLSDYCKEAGYKFLIELLVPATAEQMKNSNKNKYDNELRPKLTVRAIADFQAAGVEPDMWKNEGMDSSESYVKEVAQIKSGERSNVNLIILGRGESESHVEQWLKAGRVVPGVTGFAIGRTIFWQALVDYKDDKINAEQAVHIIAQRYQYFYQVFKS